MKDRSRRHFITSSIAATLAPNIGHAEISKGLDVAIDAAGGYWGFFALEATKGVIDQAGGHLFDAAIGMPSTEQLMTAINAGFADLKKFISAEILKARKEERFQEIKDDCRAVDQALRDLYTARKTKNVDLARVSLQDAYSKNNSALHNSSSLGPMGISAYAIAGSQRAQVIAATLTGANAASWRPYRTEVDGHISYLDSTMKSLMGAMEPDARLKAMVCDAPRPDDSMRISRNGSGNMFGGFRSRPPHMNCTAARDGDTIALDDGDYYNGDDWDKVHNLSGQVWARQRDLLAVEKSNAENEIRKPATVVLEAWGNLKNTI